jgi:hypothetical protein
VATPEQQHGWPRHGTDPDLGRGDVRRLGVVHPQHTAGIGDRFEPVRERRNRPQACRDPPPGIDRRVGRIRGGDRERRSQRVPDVVVA